jgi:hypothetical protein
MSEYGWIWQPLSFLILAICLGFLIVWILFRMSVKDLREEIRNLRDRLRRSESTASKRAKEQNLEAPRLIRHPMQDRRALALVDTGTVQEAEKDVRLSDSEGSDRSPLGRRVRLTKRLGKETQIKLQTSFTLKAARCCAHQRLRRFCPDSSKPRTPSMSSRSWKNVDIHSRPVPPAFSPLRSPAYAIQYPISE